MQHSVIIYLLICCSSQLLCSFAIAGKQEGEEGLRLRSMKDLEGKELKNDMNEQWGKKNTSQPGSLSLYF